MRPLSQFEHVLTELRRGRSRPVRPGAQQAAWQTPEGIAHNVACHSFTDVKRVYDTESGESDAFADGTVDTGPFVFPVGLGVGELRQLRRCLARKFHPDRAMNSEVQAATEQMSRINQMIDEALARASCF